MWLPEETGILSSPLKPIYFDNASRWDHKASFVGHVLT